MTSLKINADGIPSALKAMPRWVCWRSEQLNGRPTKVPYQADGRAHAESDNPATWGTFAAALTTYQAGGFDGVGIMLGDGLAGIDLDSCRNPDTGAIDEWAQEHIDRFPSYAEVSPTGTGVKLIIHGQFPTEKTGGKTGNRNKPNGTSYGGKEPGIEAYHRGRYFALTGHKLESAPADVQSFNGELTEWFNLVFARPEVPPATGDRIAHAADELLVVRRAVKYLEKCEPAVSGQRGHDACFHVACVLRCEFGLSVDDSLAAIGDWNARCDPPWSEAELRKKLIDAGQEPVTNRLRDTESERPAKNRKKPKRPKSAPPDSDGDPLSIFHPEGQTDLANARRFIRLHGDKVRYCGPWKSWVVWTGKQWSRDETGAVELLAKDVPDQIFRAASACNEIETMRFAVRSASSRGIKAMLALAESEPGVAILPDEFDIDFWLLNCANGVLDLRTGELRPHDPKLLLSKLCPTDYDPEAPSHEFEKCLEGIFNGNGAIIDFLRRLMGMCICGETTEEILPIWFGTGSNGKTLLLKLFLAALGTDYAMTANRELLMEKKGERHPTELAGLFGKRLVVSIETDDGHELAEGLVKQLTGRDRIRARGMHENFWEFEPTHKVILATNHKPRIKGTDHAIWRRIALLAFLVKFWNEDKGESGPSELKADGTLGQKLKAELPGVLAWMVAGCLEWQRIGLKVPGEVQQATAEYRSAEDVLAAFIAAKCIVMPGVKMKAGDGFKIFKHYCKEAGEKTDFSQRRFGEAMTDRGFERTISNGTWYTGVGLTAEAQDEANEPDKS